MKKGRPYYYVREIARVDGKPKVANQVYLGSPERILEMAIQHIRPVKTDMLTSQMFWQKWNRAGEKQLQRIANEFFRRIAAKEL